MNEIVVTIKDANGNSFSKAWSGKADRANAVRWTLSYQEDFQYCLDVTKIVEITIAEKA